MIEWHTFHLFFLSLSPAQAKQLPSFLLSSDQDSSSSSCKLLCFLSALMLMALSSSVWLPSSFSSCLACHRWYSAWWELHGVDPNVVLLMIMIMIMMRSVLCCHRLHLHLLNILCCCHTFRPLLLRQLLPASLFLPYPLLLLLLPQLHGANDLPPPPPPPRHHHPLLLSFLSSASLPSYLSFFFLICIVRIDLGNESLATQTNCLYFVLCFTHPDNNHKRNDNRRTDNNMMMMMVMKSAREAERRKNPGKKQKAEKER